MFTLTERLTVGVGLSQSGTIDLGSYVDVADRQAIQIHSVDYIFQGATAGATMSATFGSDADVHVQLLDLNRGGLVFECRFETVCDSVISYWRKLIFPAELGKDLSLFFYDQCQTGRILKRSGIYPVLR